MTGEIKMKPKFACPLCGKEGLQTEQEPRPRYYCIDEFCRVREYFGNDYRVKSEMLKLIDREKK